MRKHRDFWQGELQKKGLYTEDVELLTKKKSEYQSDSIRLFFHVLKWKHQCWLLQEPIFLLTATPLQVQHNGRAEAQQPILYRLGCVAITVCSHILPMNKEKNYSAKKMQFLAICFSSAFGWWHGTATKYSIALFWRHPVCLQCWKTPQHWNRASNERFLKLVFLLDAELRLLNLRGSQTVTWNCRFSQENLVIFCASHVPEVT